MKTKLLFILLSLAIISQTKAQITWATDIAPILYTNCTNCHNEGGIAPFSLIGYTNAKTYAANMASVTQSRKMPPWPADLNYHRYAKERILSFKEIETIATWVKEGSVQGDANKAPKDPSSVTTAVFSNPSIKLQMPKYTVNTTADEYRCFVLPTGITLDQYITGIEVIPGNRQVVHHVLVFQDTSGIPAKLDQADPKPGYLAFGGTGSNSSQLVGVYVPGQEPYIFPVGFGARILKNANIILQIHYPSGIQNSVDSTHVRINLSTNTLRPMIITPAINHLNTSLTNGPLYIPADQTKTFYSKTAINYKLSIFAVAPHMHLVGKSIKAYNVFGKDTTRFINIPEWDFHWQRTYEFNTPTIIEKGSTMWGEAYYDNTSNNLNNPNSPPKAVSLGEGTKDEMMLVYFWLTTYFPGDESIVIDKTALKNISAVVLPRVSQSSVYPNPGNHLCQINSKIPIIGYELYNNQGQILKSSLKIESHLNNSTAINTDDLPNGIYFLKWTTESGSLHSARWIKSN